jgi:hypothetical protein
MTNMEQRAATESRDEEDDTAVSYYGSPRFESTPGN